MDPKTLYALVLISGAGHVTVTPGLPSRPVCEDVAQVARNGKTVGEEAEASRARDERARLEREERERRDIESGNKVSSPLVYNTVTLGEPTYVSRYRCLPYQESAR